MEGTLDIIKKSLAFLPPEPTVAGSSAQLKSEFKAGNFKKIEGIRTPFIKEQIRTPFIKEQKKAEQKNLNDVVKKTPPLAKETTTSQPPQPKPEITEEQARSGIRSLLSQYGLEDLSGEVNIPELIKDIRERGLDVAAAMEQRAREAAERRYRAIKENLARQRGLIEELAGSQKQQALETERFYKGELEKRRTKEVEEIGEMKEGEKRSFLEQKDELGATYSDTIKKLEAKFRGLGVASSGWATAEERKLLQDFNKNLSKLTMQHRDVISELNKAIIDTNETYDSRIAELEKETRDALRSVDDWIKQQVVSIQNADNMALADKFDAIAEAINKADAVRTQVENAYRQQQLQWAQWLKNLQIQIATAAQEAAAKGRIDYAKSLAQVTKQQAEEMKEALSMGLARFEPTGDGNYTWYYYSPTQGKYIEGGVIDEDGRNALSLWMQKKIAPSTTQQVGLLQQELGLAGGTPLPPQLVPATQQDQKQPENKGLIQSFLGLFRR